MPDRNRRRSHRRIREMFGEQEARDQGSLTQGNIKAIQNLLRNDFSYRETREVTGFPLSTIHKYGHMVVKENFFPPGTPLSEKLKTVFGIVGTSPSPSQSGQEAGSKDVGQTIVPALDVAQPEAPSTVVHEKVVFSGTLLASVKKPAVVSFLVPNSSIRSVLQLTASGPAFTVVVFSATHRIGNSYFFGNEVAWRSPLV